MLPIRYPRALGVNGADQRYNWVEVRLARIDDAEMRELVLEAWSVVVPKGVAESYFNPGGEK